MEHTRSIDTEWSEPLNLEPKREDRCSYHNKQSSGELRVLLRFNLSVMSAIYGRNSAAKSCSDCQIRHTDRGKA